MTVFEDSFSEEVWASTYKYHEDKTVDDTFRRVAKAVASVEKTAVLRQEWEEKFWSLPTEELEKVKSVVAVNKFKDLDFSKYSKEARDVLQYYMVTRDEAEQMLKEKNS